MILLHFYVGFIVFVTAMAAKVIDCNLPYFPIEISRMAASGPFALNIFRIGLSLPLAILLFLLEEGGYCTPRWLAWVALQIIIWLDDVHYWGWHMVGVVLLGASAVWALYIEPAHLSIFLIAGVIWCIRLALKGMSVWFLELNDNERRISHVFDRSLDIMYGIGYGMNPDPATVVCFQIAGALQWVVFILLGGII